MPELSTNLIDRHEVLFQRIQSSSGSPVAATRGWLSTFKPVPETRQDSTLVFGVSLTSLAPGVMPCSDVPRTLWLGFRAAVPHL